ncbi:hypothetical protein C8F04DRAFT_1178358 [Mycena alexandri]|uniref:Uncharacterized protein n=1 Tax=Mycena alexandri TaxID=1745969 RepID=A0AAD6T580_9AGAR|nr:hypothetical protein C8F04DRAFT_1178358 [Mycena alexandri]
MSCFAECTVFNHIENDKTTIERQKKKNTNKVGVGGRDGGRGRRGDVREWRCDVRDVLLMAALGTAAAVTTTAVTTTAAATGDEDGGEGSGEGGGRHRGSGHRPP